MAKSPAQPKAKTAAVPAVPAADEKIDLTKLHKADYAAPKTPQLVNLAPAQYLAVSGRGEPGGDSFSERVGALYNVAYTIKMTRKFAGRGDYKVCALEGLWWVEGDSCGANFAAVPKERWCWTLLIRTPDFINAEDLAAAFAALAKKGKGPVVNEVRLEQITEGRCVQMLHTGPYATEPETIAQMHEFAQSQGLAFTGPHHEIYLGDPRRVPPERLRTILRMPVK